MCPPLLSLIDTAVVGVYSGTTQQAALSPAVVLTDYSIILLGFMFAATTNLVAKEGIGESHQQSTADSSLSAAAMTLISSLQLSIFLGTASAILLYIYSVPLLTLLVSNPNISPSVFGAALEYINIRCIGLPAAIFIGSAQAACLGLHDVTSPLYVLVAAALVNLIGDIALVPKWGAAGAAGATVFSQYAAAFIFIGYLKAPKVINMRSINKLLRRTNAKAIGEGGKDDLSEDISMVEELPSWDEPMIIHRVDESSLVIGEKEEEPPQLQVVQLQVELEQLGKATPAQLQVEREMILEVGIITRRIAFHFFSLCR